jgi:hypothetical protein
MAGFQLLFPAALARRATRPIIPLKISAWMG